MERAHRSPPRGFSPAVEPVHSWSEALTRARSWSSFYPMPTSRHHHVHHHHDLTGRGDARVRE